MFPSDERKQKSLDRPGWVKLPSGLVGCFVKDISDGGAKLIIAADLGVPDKFALYFTEDLKVSRRCVVVSRSGDETAVVFVGRGSPPEQPDSVVEI